jgi:regulator of sigma E protease
VTSFLAFIFVLGVLIFVHELGHFLMARRIGVRVLTFSLGFGPKLLSFRRGETEYCVSAIPLGGYVKMAGENPEDARTGAPDEFLSKSKWQRFQVLVMGPVMNVLLAIVVMAVVLYQGAPVPLFETQPVVVGSVLPNTPAVSAGIRPGDRILMVDDEQVDTWEHFSIAIVPKAKRRVHLVIDRGGKRMEQDIVPTAEGKFEVGDIGIAPVMRPQVSSVNHGDPAEEAGLRSGDVIVGVAGERNIPKSRVIDLIRANDGKPLVFAIERDGAARQVTVTPRKTKGAAYGVIGAYISDLELRTIEPGPLQAVQMSLARNWDWSKLIVKTLIGLFTRDTSVKQLMGPVAIADLSGTAAEAGWLPLFSLMAMISLNLGLLNLMPVPVLDGGHIAILALEGLSRRDFSIKVKEKMLLAGFVLLLMLMVTVIYNDLTRVQWIERLMPWR